MDKEGRAGREKGYPTAPAYGEGGNPHFEKIMVGGEGHPPSPFDCTTLIFYTGLIHVSRGNYDEENKSGMAIIFGEAGPFRT